MRKIKFKERVRYEFDNLMSKGPLPPFILLAIGGFIFILFLAVIIYLFNLIPTDKGTILGLSNPNNYNLIDVFWVVVLRTLDNNVFRLKGLYSEAAYLRELFDEPATILYQISALVRTVDEASAGDSQIDQETITEQLDELILGAIEALEGAQEKEIVRRLLRLRTLISDPSCEREEEVLEAQAELMREVNAFFYERLMAVPTIRAYIESLQA